MDQIRRGIGVWSAGYYTTTLVSDEYMSNGPRRCSLILRCQLHISVYISLCHPTLHRSMSRSQQGMRKRLQGHQICSTTLNSSSKHPYNNLSSLTTLYKTSTFIHIQPINIGMSPYDSMDHQSHIHNRFWIILSFYQSDRGNIGNQMISRTTP